MQRMVNDPKKRTKSTSDGRIESHGLFADCEEVSQKKKVLNCVDFEIV